MSILMNRYRILCALGPGDVIRSYTDWKSGQALISETSITYSSQAFDFCRANNLEMWAIGSHPRSELIDDGQFKIENRPKKPAEACGLQYHIRQLRYALSLLVSALRYKADLVIADSGTTHWFFLVPLKLFGINVVANLHNVYWPVGYPPKSKIQKLIMRIDQLFFSRFADAALGVSPECERQVNILASRKIPFFQYRAQFQERDFITLEKPEYQHRPFRVVFASRVERNKGVFDLLEIAERLAKNRPHQVVFDICGSGSAFAELENEVRNRGLSEIVHLKGRLNRPDLLRIYAQSHLVIVPTRSDFCEGMPMVCAEGVLAGRPVLTSRLANATDVLGGAVIEAKPEDITDYSEKIEHLLDNKEEYFQHCAACNSASLQFIDSAHNLTAALNKMLKSIRPERQANPLAMERNN